MIPAAARSPRRPEQNDAITFTRLGYPIGGWNPAPNPVHIDGATYIGTIGVDTAGNIQVAKYDETTKAFTLSPFIDNGYADWHDAPGVLVRSSDKKILIAYSAHGTTPVLNVALSTNAEDVSAWGAGTDISSTLGTHNNSYPTLTQLSGESGKIYLFWRYFNTGTNQSLWYLSTSTDGGSTWSAGHNYWSPGANNRQGYSLWSSDNNSRIDFVAGDDSSNGGGLAGSASAYHFYYTGGNFYKTDGTLIGAASSTTVTPSTATKIYDGSTNGSMLVPGGVANNGSGPCATLLCLNAADNGSPSSPTHPLNFWYATYSGGTWTTNVIEADGQAPNYNIGTGNAVPDPNDPTVVYACQFPGNVSKNVTANAGASWTTTQLTFDTDPLSVNLYPVPVRGASPTVKVVWMYGPQPAFFTAYPMTWALRGA